MRLFVALETPEPLQREIAGLIGRMRGEVSKARWVRPEGMHLTLVFFGETDPASLPALRDRLAPAFARFPPLTLAVRGAGTFPPGRPARVAWLGVQSSGPDGGADLPALQAAVAESAVEAAAAEPERRPFHPHLTLARPARPWTRREVERFLVAADRPWGEPYPVPHGVLVESTLGAGGSRYRTVETFPLEGRERPAEGRG